MKIKSIEALRLKLPAREPSRTGRHMDDTAHWIQDFAWLSDADKKRVFEGNARQLYKLDKILAG